MFGLFDLKSTKKCGTKTVMDMCRDCKFLYRVWMIKRKVAMEYCGRSRMEFF